MNRNGCFVPIYIYTHTHTHTHTHTFSFGHTQIYKTYTTSPRCTQNSHTAIFTYNAITQSIVYRVESTNNMTIQNAHDDYTKAFPLIHPTFLSRILTHTHARTHAEMYTCKQQQN